MGKLGKKWHKKSLYSKAMTLFIILLLMLTILFLLYVTSTMVMYEESLIDNHIKKLVTSGSLADNIEIEDYEKNKYETSNISSKNGLKKLFKTSDIEIVKSKKEKGNVYDLYLNDANVATISFEKVGSQTKMLILTIDEWKIKEITTNFDRGIYYYDIIIPTNYKLYINNKEVTDSYKESNIEELERVTEYVEVAKTNVYTLDNFIEKPDIVIKDENGKKVKYDLNNNKIEITKEFKTYKTYEEAKEKLNGEIDILALAENWSLFLTDDLNGYFHGFTKLTPYLIKDSYMYQMAYNWSHNVDITFVSRHSLKNPVFTNEYVKNCTVYNENAFKCEVNLEKNMVVNGQDKVDTLHDYLYFVNYEGGWKLVDMKSITE